MKTKTKQKTQPEDRRFQRAFANTKELSWGLGRTSMANLLYRVSFKNNLRNRVCFKINYNGGQLFTLIPPFLLAASMYRHWQHRHEGGIASSTSEIGADWARRWYRQ